MHEIIEGGLTADGEGIAMRVFGMRSVAMAGLMALWFSGCGDNNNVLGGLADDSSIQAKTQDGQAALDRGDCQTAINDFTDVFDHDPNDVKARINLSGAYACRAGFIARPLIKVAANFIASGQSVDQFNLFKSFADDLVPHASSTWDADTDQALSLLTDLNLTPTVTCNPAPFAYDSDAAFHAAFILAARSVLALSQIQGSTPDVILISQIQNNPAVVTQIGNSLSAADGGMACANSLTGGTVISDSALAQSIHDLNLAAGTLLAPADLELFLSDQGFTLQ
jgi:hypothetical protein